MEILNLTQHKASKEQIDAGVVEPGENLKKDVIKGITFDDIPKESSLTTRAFLLAQKASNTGCKKAMIGGAPFFMPRLAEALKKVPEFKAPEWISYVKTGTSRERPPTINDFWYIRAASILRQLYIKGVVGVGKLRTRYGSRKDRGGKPDRFRKAGGKIIRVILQQAEAAGLVEKITRLQFGRRLTQKGRDFLDSIEVKEKIGINYTNVQVPKTNVKETKEETEKLEEEKIKEETEEVKEKKTETKKKEKESKE